MIKRDKYSANILGDLRGEVDISMLDNAFYETPDYRTLIESTDRTLVVGRRGSGKSALLYRLTKYWSVAKDTKVIHIIPDEDQVIGIRPILKIFGEKFNLIRAGSRITWRYAIYMEIANLLDKHYKSRSVENYELLTAHLKRWRQNKASVTSNIRNILKQIVNTRHSPEECIAELSTELLTDTIQKVISDALELTGFKFVILIDQLDEGYEPDNVGVGFIDGLVQATIDIKTRLNNVRPTLFLRDNIFRTVALLDPDYSRTIEGHVIRLHWDEQQLFYLVCSRLRFAFKLELENNLRIWNTCVSNELIGMDGFKKCLRLTLYRPRDVLALLNEAFYEALKLNSERIVDANIEATAKSISINRLNDLHKEYSAICPGLIEITNSFANRNPELTVKEASLIIEKLLSSDTYDPPIQQDFIILETAQEVIRTLYSVGFIGIFDPATEICIFCHDGRNPNKEFKEDRKILIHPCYWMALNLTRNILDKEEAEDIYDEYEIEISSVTAEIRKRKIDVIIKELNSIPSGKDGAYTFEDWCFKAIRVAFAGSLRNVEHKPNLNATQRRDIVATNLSEKGVWKRILDDYGTRQVIFEIKNYEDLTQDDYRQMHSYLTGEYGRLGFIITRDDSENISKDRELNWVKEFYYHDHKVLIIKLTGKLLCDILDKLRNAQKYDFSDHRLNKLLDTYVRLYLSGQTVSKNQK